MPRSIHCSRHNLDLGFGKAMVERCPGIDDAESVVTFTNFATASVLPHRAFDPGRNFQCIDFCLFRRSGYIS